MGTRVANIPAIEANDNSIYIPKFVWSPVLGELSKLLSNESLLFFFVVFSSVSTRHYRFLPSVSITVPSGNEPLIPSVVISHVST
ncbi:hypothetical protein BM530_15990, partial [Clostridioides difficile]